MPRTLRTRIVLALFWRVENALLVAIQVLSALLVLQPCLQYLQCTYMYAVQGAKKALRRYNMLGMARSQ